MIKWKLKYLKQTLPNQADAINELCGMSTEGEKIKKGIKNWDGSFSVPSLQPVEWNPEMHPWAAAGGARTCQQLWGSEPGSAGSQNTNSPINSQIEFGLGTPERGRELPGAREGRGAQENPICFICGHLPL